ncbi:MAG: YfhO family protein [bacterium]|nr:YfhO family protein [bacterium]
MVKYLEQLKRVFTLNHLAYIALFLLPLSVFWKATIGTHIFVVGDLSGSDLLELHLPFKQALHDSYTKFEFPLWTPYLANGFPILAEGQSGPLYPPHILLSFLPAYLGLNYSILLTFIIAGWGGYTYARTLPKMSLFSAFCVGLIFMFSSFFIARVKHLNMIIVAAYFPWTLFCIRQFFLSAKFKWFFTLGFVWSLQILAGHPHMFYFCVIMNIWYLIGESGKLYFERKQLEKGKVIWFFLCGVVGIILSGLISIGLSAAQLLPTYELSRLSARSNFTYQIATDFPLRIPYLVSFFAPFFLGNPASGSYKGNIHTDGIWWENVMYIGLFPFSLSVVLIAFVIWRAIRKLFVNIEKTKDKKRRERTSEGFYYYFYFFLVTALIFYVLGMGSASFLFGLLYDNLPGMRLFRFPNRFTLFSLFSVCVIAGWGIEQAILKLMASRHNVNNKEADSEYTFAWPLSLSWTRVFVCIIILLDLVVFAYQYISFYSISSYLKKPDIINIFDQDKRMYRIYPTTQYSQNPFGAMGWNKGEEAIKSLQVSLPGNFSVYYKLFSFTDRGWFEGGLGLKDRFFLENTLLKNELPGQYVSQILAHWNVKYFIGFQEFDNNHFSQVKKYTLDKSFAAPLYVYKNNNVLDRAYIVRDLIPMQTNERVMEQIATATESAGIYAYKIGEEREPGSEKLDYSKVRDSKVLIRAYSGSRVEMEAASTIANGGYLVFSDSNYPGWKAYVDGKDTPIVQVNLVQRAIKINKGEHKIIWVYSPVMFHIGLGISFATWVTLICWYLFIYKKKGELGKKGEADISSCC